MPRADCAKQIINDQGLAAMKTFHRFAKRGLVKSADFDEVAGAEAKMLKVVTAVNKRIADRQPEGKE